MLDLPSLLRDEAARPARLPDLRAENVLRARRRLSVAARRGRRADSIRVRGHPSLGRTTTCGRCGRSTPRARRARGCSPARRRRKSLCSGRPRWGLNLFAGGLDWQPGDEVVYCVEDYPTNVYPWMDLARRGVVPACVET